MAQQNSLVYRGTITVAAGAHQNNHTTAVPFDVDSANDNASSIFLLPDAAGAKAEIVTDDAKPSAFQTSAKGLALASGVEPRQFIVRSGTGAPHVVSVHNTSQATINVDVWAAYS